MQSNITTLPAKASFRPFDFTPTTFEEALQFATVFASSGLCPEAFRGKPNDVLVVWQMGAELGIGKAQSLRTFGCIKGQACAYGDGKFALITKRPDFEDAKEWFEGKIEDGTMTAYCTIKRKGREPVTRQYSIQDAKRANLWSKAGTWQQYPQRMLQHRARGFAVNDSFPDAFYGIPDQQEVEDMVDVTPVAVEAPKASGKGMAALAGALGVEPTPAPLEGEVLQAEPEASEPCPLESLKLLMADKKAAAAVARFLTKAKVATVEELQGDQIQKIITHLTKKET